MQDPGASSPPKLFVLDTNVVLHDSDCLRAFADNDVVIPLVVLEELDRFKRGHADIHFHARHFLRRLDELTGDALSYDGVSMGEGQGTLRIIGGGALDPELRARFLEDSADHRILGTALALRKREASRVVVVVSKDTNLRMKAKSLGLVAQDYTADKVESIERLYTGKRLIDGVPGDLIRKFYDGAGELPAEQVECVEEPHPNENFILRNGSMSVLATYSSAEKVFRRLGRKPAYGIQPRNAEQSFALHAVTDDAIRLVTLAGTAGTGKTLLALAGALECRSRYRQILLARPVVPLSNRDLGFLPGDIDAKLEPYMQPLEDNLSVIRNEIGERDKAAQRLEKMQESGKLLITALPYIRGRSLPRVYFIVDEAQNLTPHEVKTIITRAGEGTKIVLTGDIRQIDQPYLDSLSNGVSYLIHRMVGQPLYAHVTLEKGERSELSNLASELL